MECGFETIGNATLIVHDMCPVLVTDPWIHGDAYFRSWTLAYEIPEEQLQAIHQAQYVWISHGHPDHLSSASLKLLKDKKILLAEHVGKRIFDGLKSQGYDVHILKDRKWTKLSERIKVVCISDFIQDSILLVDVDGTLIINLNDASDRGWGAFVRKTVNRFKTSFLLAISGYGDADMYNLFDENGHRLIDAGEHKKPFGHMVARRTELYGAKYFVPFSSMHAYQREDSIWARELMTPVSHHKIGFESEKSEILPAFIRYDCRKDQVEEILPSERWVKTLSPDEIGDSWSDLLDKEDFQQVKNYFSSIEHIDRTFGFINVKVGGKHHPIKLHGADVSYGITFEVPRNSLMTAIRYRIFDDLLIGNFMKTTIHGYDSRPLWRQLYPHFSFYVAKFADNANVKSEEE
ncbi:MAG: MBL fold metallo-hydrolase [Candidatus Omnitrophota bacterium]|nr:MBL fold metallo-hydrolase [Candidatus Omnitrophota bacterium]